MERFENFNNNGIIFPNFIGQKSYYYPNGEWSFCITIPSSDVKRLKKEGVNVKSLPVRKESDILGLYNDPEWRRLRMIKPTSKKYYFFKVTLAMRYSTYKLVVNGKPKERVQDSNIRLKSTDGKIYLLTEETVKILQYIAFHSNEVVVNKYEYLIPSRPILSDHRQKAIKCFLDHMYVDAYKTSSELEAIARENGIDL